MQSVSWITPGTAFGLTPGSGPLLPLLAGVRAQELTGSWTERFPSEVREGFVVVNFSSETASPVGEYLGRFAKGLSINRSTR
jgi:hypothetical protein